MPRPEGTYAWNPIPEDLLWQWYWEDLFSAEEIAQKWGEHPESQGEAISAAGRDYPTNKWVIKWMERYGIPKRDPTKRSRLWQLDKTTQPSKYKTVTINGKQRKLHRVVFEKFNDVKLSSDDNVHHKDHVRHNNHPLNLELLSRAEHSSYHTNNRIGHNKESVPSRIPIYEVYMRWAETLALRSHHDDIKVGCVITSFDLRRTLALGFNGNAAGLANDIDSDVPGRSGTIHAEENALLYAPGDEKEKVLFTSYSPCLMCVKRMINAGVKYIYYRNKYRDTHPLKVARYRGIQVCHYTKWQDHWR